MLSCGEKEKRSVGSMCFSKNIFMSNTGKSLYLDVRTEKTSGLVKNYLCVAEGQVPIFNGPYEMF